MSGSLLCPSTIFLIAFMHRRQFFSGLRITSGATLASRVLGMVRDMATASLFGLSGGGVMDAFVVAFRIPNLFRRLFGEGALAASFLPVLARHLEADRQSAWRIVSVTLSWLTVILLVLLLMAEAVLVALYGWSSDPSTQLLAGLTATMMPYMVLICLTAQLAATLHALGHFMMPALAPIMLNVCWLIGVWLIAPRFAPNQQAQAYVLAVCVLVAGVAQLSMQLPPLLRAGFRFQYDWSASRDAVLEIVRAVLPTVFGLAITQLNTLADVMLAWGLSATPERGETIAWLGDAVSYPMVQGAAAALYYGERLYQFPLGILGIAVATVIFPLLSRHAARGDHDKLGADLTLGLRLISLLALPASVGLMLLAEPITRLLFERGQFTVEDTQRTARVIVCYGAGVWAFCALPVLIRGYYALSDRATPVRLGAAMVVLNLLLSLALIWPLGEAGLAVATSICAALEVALLALIFSRRAHRMAWAELLRTVVISALATLLMGTACYLTLSWMPDSEGLMPRLAAVLGPVAVSLLVYFATIKLAAPQQLRLLSGRADGM